MLASALFLQRLAVMLRAPNCFGFAFFSVSALLLRGVWEFASRATTYYKYHSEQACVPDKFGHSVDVNGYVGMCTCVYNACMHTCMHACIM